MIQKQTPRRLAQRGTGMKRAAIWTSRWNVTRLGHGNRPAASTIRAARLCDSLSIFPRYAMKSKNMKLVALLVLSLSIVAISAMALFPSPEEEDVVRHIVVFKYTPDASEAQIQEITDAFRALKDKIPGIVSFEHGVNNSPEDKNQGFTHAYVMTFEDVEARDAYLPHPEHQKFGELLAESGIFEDAFVVDYVPQE